MRLFLFILTIVTPGTVSDLEEKRKTYSIKKIDGNLSVTGRGDDPQWRQANALTDFLYPWEKEKAPPTLFKALHNDQWVYFLFDVIDTDVNVRRVSDDKMDVAGSSRVEIFFRQDERLDPYYCLELDPLGRVLDYKGTYHRKFDFQSAWPEGGLIVRTDKNPDGYTVEFAISMESLRQLGLVKNCTLQAGLFRANCSHANGEETFKWMSWMKPEAKTPDFHIPSSFGLLRLE